MDSLKMLIQSSMDSTGFTEFHNQTKKMENQINSIQGKFSGLGANIKSVFGTGLKLAGGYFAFSKLTSEYNKAIELSNYQLEQETKLQATLRGQGFRDEQIQNIKNYASELQKVGVVGDEVTLAGAQQLATYNLTEDSLKALLPAMQDVLVQQKGLNGTGQDAVNVANMLAKGLLGQVGILEKAGITLTEQERKMIKFGNQEQKVLALVKAVKENVGEQNKEFLKTPEGKIASAGNRIGDVYENIGMMFRDVRADYHKTLADSLEYWEPFLKGTAKGLASGFDTFNKASKGLFNTFKNMPPELKIGIGALTGFFAITTFPVTAGLVALEDFMGGLQGKESLIGGIIDKTTEFLNIDFKFNDLVKAFQDLNKPLEDFDGTISKTWATLKGFTEFIKSGFYGSIGAIKKAFGVISDIATFDFNFTNTKEFGNKELKKSNQHFINVIKTGEILGNDIARKKEEEKIERIRNNTSSNIKPLGPRKNEMSYMPTTTINISSDGVKVDDLERKIQETIEIENRKHLNEMKAKLGGVYQ